MITGIAVLISALLLAGIFTLAIETAQAVKIDFLGDIGCAKSSFDNLRNIQQDNIFLWGLGDYLYKCSTTKTDYANSNGDSLQSLYDNIQNKMGCWGNHELEKNEGKGWAQSNFNIQNNDMFSRQIDNVLVICLNTFKTKYDSNSPHIKSLVSLLESTKNDNSGIDWIVVTAHEVIYTPKVKGGHNANSLLRDTLMILLQEYGGIFVGAHNHITAYDIRNNVPIMICGGGGKGGDSISSMKGFNFATKDPAYCQLDFQSDTKLNLNVKTAGGQIKTFLLLERQDSNDTEPIPMPEIGSIQIDNGPVWIPTLNGTEIINATSGLLNYTK